MRPRSPTGLVALALLGLLAAASPVAGHSDLESTDPGNGAQLVTAPRWVVLRFSNPLDPSVSSVRVTDESGARVDLEDLRVDNGAHPVLNVSLRGGLPDGAYLVRWSITSEDGHPASGHFGFAIGNATAPVVAQGAGSGLPEPASLAGRVLSYVGLCLAFGGVAWLWLIRPRPDGIPRIATAALMAGAALHAAGALLLFQATSNAATVDAGTLAASETGRWLALRIVVAVVAAALAATSLAKPGLRSAAPAAACLAVVAAVATAAVGHAASEGLAGGAVDAMHLLASTTWAGSLALFVVALTLAGRQGLPADTLRRAGLRFGTVALACVIVLVLFGTATALLILGRTALLDPLHLTGSLYGRLLLAKVGLAALMVAVASVNRFLFLGAPAADAGGFRARMALLGPDGTPRGLRRTVALEAALGLLVLVIAGALTAVSPTDHDGRAGHLHEVTADGESAGPTLPPARTTGDGGGPGMGIRGLDNPPAASKR
ncbi:MAG: copper resistance CopC/CopD family protein [Thermoplasmatota archaeon]